VTLLGVASFPIAGHFLEALRSLDTLEWIVVGVAALVSVWVIWRAVLLTLHPGEDEPDHIKRMILRDDDPSGASAPGRVRTR
jgi:hypothetical protein